MSAKKLFIIFLFIIFVGGGAAGYWYYKRLNFSKGLLKVEILGPQYPQAGDEVEYLVRYKNNGNITLEDANLTFQFPNNAVPAQNGKLIEQKKIGIIYPGEEKSLSFKAVLFGQKGDILTAHANISYHPKDLRTVYQSPTTFTCQIKYVPLNFEFDLPSKIESGQKLAFSLNYFSNFSHPLENLRVRIEYPSDFQFQDSEPKALDATTWPLPLVNSSNGGKIKITGKINGIIGQQKIFKAQIGVVRNSNFIVLKKIAQSVEIAESSLYISQLVNGLPNYSADFNETLHYEVFFKNVGKAPLERKFIIVKLNSPIFDLGSLQSKTGSWGKGDNTIIFDWKKVPQIRFLDVGEEGEVDFWINTKKLNPDQHLSNPILQDAVSIGGMNKNFKINIHSTLALAQKLYFKDSNILSSIASTTASSTASAFATSSENLKAFSGFSNQGPLPPRVSQSTTYTVLWEVKNTCNEVDNLRIKSILPENVKFTGKVFPQNARVTFDQKSREVFWNVNQIKPWQGFQEPPLVLVFQISFTPLAQDRGATHLLLGKTEITGEDKFTGETLRAQASQIDTTLPDDKTVSNAQGVVQ